MKSNPYPRTRRRQWKRYTSNRVRVINFDTHKILALVLLSLSLVLLQLPVSEAVTSTPDNTNNPSSASLSSTTTAKSGLGIPPTGTTSTNPISPLGIVDNDQQESSSAATTTTTKKKTKKNLPKKKSTNKPPSTKKTSSSSSLSGSKAMFIQRVQREWKDAVQMGIAYDWLKQKPVMTKKSKRKQQLAKLREQQPASLAFVSTTATATTSNTEQEQRSQYLCLGPLGKNLFVWHFSFLGLEGSDFEGGLYHGRIVLPTNYPMSPPRVQVWTPSGRFIPRADICLSASAFHPESWNPAAYNLRTIVESLRLHMLTHAMEIGGTNATPKKRRALAVQSRSWKQGFIEKKNQQRFWVDHALLTEQGVFAAADAVVGNDTTDNTSCTDTETASAPTDATANTATEPATITSDPAIIPTSTAASVATTILKQKNKKKAKRKNKIKTKKKDTLGRAVKRKQEPGLLIRFVQALIDNRSLLVALLVVYVYFSIVNRSNPIIVVV